MFLGKEGAGGVVIATSTEESEVKDIMAPQILVKTEVKNEDS